MSRPNILTTLAAGFVATLAFTSLAFLAPLIYMPRTNFPGLLGAILQGGQAPRPGYGVWMLGMLWHLINGSVVFALIYAYVICPRVRLAPWQRGIAWGVVLWLAAMLVFLPIVGMGPFGAFAGRARFGLLASVLGPTFRPYLYWLTALLIHVVYGAVLGVTVGVPETEEHDEQSQPHPPPAGQPAS